MGKLGLNGENRKKQYVICKMERRFRLKKN